MHDEYLYDVEHGAQIADTRADMTRAAPQTQRLRKEFGGLVAVDDVDFTVPEGSIVSLIGPNGAGKTTFFNMLTGVYKPTAGRVVFDGRGRDRQAAARDHAARHRPHVPEHPALPEHDRARERARRHARAACKGNVVRGDPAHAAGASARRARRASAARELLDFCGLRRKDDEIGRNLPYGDQRRLEVARALATEPKLLLLDEPTAGMNPQETAEFTTFVGRLRDGAGPRRCC